MHMAARSRYSCLLSLDLVSDRRGPGKRQFDDQVSKSKNATGEQKHFGSKLDKEAVSLLNQPRAGSPVIASTEA